MNIINESNRKGAQFFRRLIEAVTDGPLCRVRETLDSVWSYIQERYDQFVDALEPETVNDPDWPDQLPPTPYGLARKPIIIGASVLGGFLGLALLWGIFAQLDSAAVATGVVAVDTSRKSDPAP